MTLQEAADAYCRRLCAGHYENFAVASPLVPAPVRLDLMRWYAFCRTTDDLGDESGSPAAALQRLTRWREETECFFDGKPPVHPVFIALAPTVERHALERGPFIDLIAANEQDQRIVRYRDYAELHAYCLLSAAPVGRVVLRLFGVENQQAEQLSDDVCIGLQLANHAQDVSRDARLGRQYLLQTDLEERGVEGAVAALVSRARALLESGVALERMVPGTLRVQIALYRLGGLAICRAIERAGYRTDRFRPTVTGAAKAGLVLRALLESASRAREERRAETA